MGSHMTPGQYRAQIKKLGLTPYRPSHDGKTLHQTREGDFRQIPDPELLSPEEREATIKLIKSWFSLGA